MSLMKPLCSAPVSYTHLDVYKRQPVLYDLVGFTGSGLSHTAWKPFGDNVPERAARLIGHCVENEAINATTLEIAGGLCNAGGIAK